MIGRYDPIFPGYDWLHEIQPISNHPTRLWGFHTVRVVSTREITVFVPGVFES